MGLSSDEKSHRTQGHNLFTGTSSGQCLSVLDRESDPSSRAPVGLAEIFAVTASQFNPSFCTVLFLHSPMSMVLKILLNKPPVGTFPFQSVSLEAQPKAVGAKSSEKKQTLRWGFEAGLPANWMKVR